MERFYKITQDTLVFFLEKVPRLTKFLCTSAISIIISLELISNTAFYLKESGLNIKNDNIYYDVVSTISAVAIGGGVPFCILKTGSLVLYAEYTAALSFSSLSVWILKHTFPKMRPDSTNEKSFPSGHAAIVVVASFFAFFIVKRRIKIYFLLLISLEICILRVLSLRHYSIDVFFGAMIGLIFSFLSHYLFNLFLASRAVAIKDQA